MTKKDFELIARTLAKIHPTNANDGLRAYVVCEFIDELKRTNVRFDVDKFLKACNCGQGIPQAMGLHAAATA